MFFAPALIVAAASTISYVSAAPLAIPADVIAPAQIAFDGEDKEAFLGSILRFFGIGKRDLEGMDEESKQAFLGSILRFFGIGKRDLEGMDEESKQAFLGSILRFFGIGKRDLEGMDEESKQAFLGSILRFFGIGKRDLEGMDEESKQAFLGSILRFFGIGKRDLEGMDDESKQAFLGSILRFFGIGKRDLEGMDDEAKQAFLGSILRFFGIGKRDLEGMDGEDKEAFLGSILRFFGIGKRDLEGMDDEAKQAFLGSILRFFGIGKRDLEGMDDEAKQAFLGSILRFFGIGKRDLESIDEEKLAAGWSKWIIAGLGGLISGLPDVIHGNKNKRDIEVFARALSTITDIEEEKLAKLPWGKIFEWALPIGTGLLAGISGNKDQQKRDLDHEVFARALAETDLSDEEKDKLAAIPWGKIFNWAFPIGTGILAGMGGNKEQQKRDLYDLPTVPTGAKRSLEQLIMGGGFAKRAVQDQGLLDALNDF